MKTTQEIAILIKKQIEGVITSEETKELKNWAQEDPKNELFLKEVLASDSVFEDVLAYMEFRQQLGDTWISNFKQNTSDKIFRGQKKENKVFRLRWIGYAAAILMVFFAYQFFYVNDKAPSSEQFQLADIEPGTNKAELTLSDGHKISLRADKEGIGGDQHLTYNDGTPLFSLAKEKLAKLTANIVVPCGGKYQVTLPDGTKVWLNSSSKLTYPLVFREDERIVRLEGEAYFEVDRMIRNGEKKKFIVQTQDQNIEVTGTEFNVSAYNDDKRTVTTLVNGAITIVSDSRRMALRPNEQATLSEKGIVKRNVDVQHFIAWKNDKFLFYETGLTDVMRAISRWYNIEVIFPEHVPATFLYGEIGRDKKLVEVLRLLEKSGVKFKAELKGSHPKLIILP
ncbi:MAG: FecR family protein [Sphingobacterium sp.]